MSRQPDAAARRSPSPGCNNTLRILGISNDPVNAVESIRAGVSSPAKEGWRVSERRRERRHAVCEDAQIRLHGKAVLPCVIRDISAGGARLDYDPPPELPLEFRLCIPSTDLSVPAVVAWRSGGQVGIRFIGVAIVGDVDEPPLDLDRRSVGPPRPDLVDRPAA